MTDTEPVRFAFFLYAISHDNDLLQTGGLLLHRYIESMSRTDFLNFGHIAEKGKFQFGRTGRDRDRYSPEIPVVVPCVVPADQYGNSSKRLSGPGIFDKALYHTRRLLLTLRGHAESSNRLKTKVLVRLK